MVEMRCVLWKQTTRRAKQRVEVAGASEQVLLPGLMPRQRDSRDLLTPRARRRDCWARTKKLLWRRGWLVQMLQIEASSRRRVIRRGCCGLAVVEQRQGQQMLPAPVAFAVDVAAAGPG